MENRLPTEGRQSPERGQGAWELVGNELPSLRASGALTIEYLVGVLARSRCEAIRRI